MHKDKKVNQKETENTVIQKPLNDGMNTPVPNQTETHVPSANEAALYKQAENPLGDPHKV